VSSFSPGMTPASESFVALTMIMNRIGVSPGVGLEVPFNPCRTAGAGIDTPVRYFGS
jgi:hypothetical protein